jgi:hypothetical protein
MRIAARVHLFLSGTTSRSQPLCHNKHLLPETASQSLDYRLTAGELNASAAPMAGMT